MPRWVVGLCLGGLAIATFACKDDLVEEVPKEVCYSGLRWVGEKRGDPEMFPGRDCVGCHLENDGPPLAIGGTLYPYLLSGETALAAQTGKDCFGIEGYTVTITDADGQDFNVTTNRAGNFYVEGNPDDFAKPFKVSINNWLRNGDPLQRNGMTMSPKYGGCGRCHNPSLVTTSEYAMEAPDADYQYSARGFIGLPGCSPDGVGGVTVEAELRALLPPAP